ncbi:hypothetical protein KMP13_02315 [Epibacterium ulvae]|uniref:hypothetical protein n=1 Tax=Epibacterium ulvae TaxID=1156985 RepID=UPI001BFC160F|nr:hypothetical protein [Epibacterium ulvae]MBT8152748.1 hypothetical protein [Epibacterium ulvae]
MTKRSERTGAAAPKAAPTSAPSAQPTPVPQTATPAPQPAVAPSSAPPPAKSETTVDMLLHRDCWDEKGVRHKKGKVVPFSVETAKKLRKSGKAERFDPLLVDG